MLYPCVPTLTIMRSRRQRTRPYAGHMRVGEIRTVWLHDGPHDVVRDSARILEDGEPNVGLAGPLLEFYEAVGSGESLMRRRVLVPMSNVLALATALTAAD